jgi:hypothetical protein
MKVVGIRQTAVVSEDFAGLASGRRYAVQASPDGLSIRGAHARAVAHLPVTPGGEVSSAEGRWQVAAERQGRGWVVVARDLVHEEPVGCAYPRWWLCQWPSSSPHWRPQNSPLVAIFSPRWWPRISPPTGLWVLVRSGA